MEFGAKHKGTAALTESVLANPRRARLAAELRTRRISPPELAEALGEPLLPVAYHCRVLEQAGDLGPRGAS